MFDDIFKNISNVDDWNNIIKKQGVSFDSSRDDLLGYSNVDVDNFVQNIIGNNPGFSGTDIDHIRQSIAEQKKNATDLLRGIQDAIELKGMDLGKNINITPSSMHDNLRFASVIGPNESVMAGLGLTTDQVNNIVMNTANQVYADLGLQNIPTRVNINYGTGIRAGSNGTLTLGSRTGIGDINVNFDNIMSNMASKGIASPEEVAKKITNTVAHEMRHQWQQHYDNTTYRNDIEGYINSATDFSGYYEQAIEKDARAYGQDFADKYAKQYYDQAMEQFPKESFVPHYQKEVDASKGFLGRVKDKISGFLGRGSQSSVLEGGGPTLENSTTLGGPNMNLPEKWNLFSPEQKDRYVNTLNHLTETYKIDNPTTIGGYASNRFYDRHVKALGDNPDLNIIDEIPTMLANYEKTIDSLSLYGSNPSIANIGGKRYSISPTGMAGGWRDNGAYDLGFTLDPLDPNDKIIDPTELFHELNPNFEKEFNGIDMKPAIAEQTRLEKMQQVMDFIDDMGMTLEGSTRAELTQQLKDVNKQRREIIKNTPNYNASYTVDEMKQMFPNLNIDTPTQTAGGGSGGKEPPKNTTTASPEPPEDPKITQAVDEWMKEDAVKQQRQLEMNNTDYNLQHHPEIYNNHSDYNANFTEDMYDEYKKTHGRPYGTAPEANTPSGSKLDPVSKSRSYDSAQNRRRGKQDKYSNGQTRRRATDRGDQYVTTYYRKDGSVKAQVIEGIDGSRHVKRLNEVDVLGETKNKILAQSIRKDGTITMYNSDANNLRVRTYNEATNEVHDEKMKRIGYDQKTGEVIPHEWGGAVSTVEESTYQYEPHHSSPPKRSERRQKKQTTQKSGPGENKTSNSTGSDSARYKGSPDGRNRKIEPEPETIKKTTNVFEQYRQQQAKDTGGTKIDTSAINKNKTQAQKQQKKQTQNKVKKEQAQHVADNIPQKEIPKQRIAKAQKGTGKYRVKGDQAVKDVSQMQVTSTGGGKIPYRIKGTSNNGALNISGGLDANGKPVFMTATVKAGDKTTKYNLLGGGKKGQYKSLASFKEQVANAMDSGVKVPQWARAAINRKSGKPRTSTYNVEEIPKSDWTETVAEEVIKRVDDNFNHRADPRSSNMGGGKEYDPIKPIMDPGAEQKAKEIEKSVKENAQQGPTRRSVDQQKYEEVEEKLENLANRFNNNEIDVDEYLHQTDNVYKQYNDYLENHWDREEARVQKEAEVKQKQVDYENATNQVERDYADGNLTDDEYVDELNKLHEEYESFMNEKYPLDDSNVLNKSEQQRSIDQMNDIVDNLTTDSSDPYNKIVDPLNKNKPQTRPTPSPDDGFELSMNQKKFNPQTPPDQRRIFTQEELDTEFDKLQDLFDDGKITNEQYTQMADKLKKRFKPLTDDELRQAKKEEIMGDPDYYLDRSGETSTIKKHFDRDDYSIDMSNTYVDQMSFDGEVYDIKYRNSPGAGERGFDAYDSQGNLVLDEKVLDKIQSQGSAELNNYFHSLTDDEWMEMRKNPTQHRFNAHDAANSGGQKYADIYNEQAVLEKQKAVLNEQISDLQNQLGNTKGKKAKKSILDAQNKKRIKNVEANRDYTILKHKAEAMKNKDAALDVFHKELGLDQFEHKSAEYFDALKKLKGTDKYKAATETLRQSTQTANQTMAKQIANTNKYANSQIKGLQGKGLTPGNVISVGMAAISAVNTYKEKRSEGKGVASSAIRAAGSAVAAEMLGMPGQLALAAAKTIPAAIMDAGEHLYQENRRMNSAANYAPLGGATFEDSQQLATMRQSGMELAKMAQYNLEQTLMGAEAKHLHR